MVLGKRVAEIVSSSIRTDDWDCAKTVDENKTTNEAQKAVFKAEYLKTNNHAMDQTKINFFT